MKRGLLFTHRNDSVQKKKKGKKEKKNIATLHLAGSTVKIKCHMHIQQAQTPGDGHLLVLKESLK